MLKFVHFIWHTEFFPAIDGIVSILFSAFVGVHISPALQPACQLIKVPGMFYG